MGIRFDKETIDDFLQFVEETIEKLVRAIQFDRTERATITAINTDGGILVFTLQNAGATNTYTCTQVNESVPTLVVGNTVVVKHIKNSGTSFYIDARIGTRT